jgi:hypothetical protein
VSRCAGNVGSRHSIAVTTPATRGTVLSPASGGVGVATHGGTGQLITPAALAREYQHAAAELVHVREVLDTLARTLQLPQVAASGGGVAPVAVSSSGGTAVGPPLTGRSSAAAPNREKSFTLPSTPAGCVACVRCHRGRVM